MGLDKARAFINENHRVVLVTRHSIGELQLTPVNIGLDGEGRGIVSSRETAFKTRNISADPRVSLCVMNDGFFGELIHIDGSAEVLSLPEALEPLVDYYKRTYGEHPDWAARRRERSSVYFCE